MGNGSGFKAKIVQNFFKLKKEKGAQQHVQGENGKEQTKYNTEGSFFTIHAVEHFETTCLCEKNASYVPKPPNKDFCCLPC